MPPTIFDDSKQMMRMKSMHQFVHPYYTDGRARLSAIAPRLLLWRE
jgi:hypothetical protein